MGRNPVRLISLMMVSVSRQERPLPPVHAQGQTILSQGANPLNNVVGVISLRGPEGPRGLELDARGKGGELTPFVPWVTSRRYLLV